MAGLSLGHALLTQGVHDFTILERGPKPGGVLRRMDVAGLSIDAGVRYVHPEDDPEVTQLLLDEVGGVLQPLHVRVLYGSRLLSFPFQEGLGGLPWRERLAAVSSLVRSRLYPRGHNGDFGSWSRCSFGSWIADNLLLPHSAKSWAIPVEEVTAAEMASKVSRPSLLRMLATAAGLRKPKPQVMINFPGGASGVTDWLAHQVAGNLLCDAAVREVRLDQHEVDIGTDTTLRYDVLVNTLPLPTFGALVKGSHQDEIAQYVGVLRRNTLMIVANAYEGAAPEWLRGTHHVYVPEPQFLPNRVSFPASFGCDVGGRHVVVSEIAMTPDRAAMVASNPLALKWVLCQLHSDLQFMGMAPESAPVGRAHTTITPAYTLTDRMTAWALRLATARLQWAGVRLLGRFAEWRPLRIGATIARARVMARELAVG